MITLIKLVGVKWKSLRSAFISLKVLEAEKSLTLFTIKLCTELQKSELYLRFTIEN